MSGSGETGAEADVAPDEDATDTFKIISKKAMRDFLNAKQCFLKFLMDADVWSHEQVTATIIDFHLVEKCRTKFRAFVKSFGAKVRFEPVTKTGKKQEYHGTVTVTRACKQQFLTQNPQVVNLQSGDVDKLCSEGESPERQLQLQCAAPVPITTGAHYVPYTEDGQEPSAAALKAVAIAQAQQPEQQREGGTSLPSVPGHSPRRGPQPYVTEADLRRGPTAPAKARASDGTSARPGGGESVALELDADAFTAIFASSISTPQGPAHAQSRHPAESPQPLDRHAPLLQSRRPGKLSLSQSHSPRALAAQMLFAPVHGSEAHQQTLSHGSSGKAENPSKVRRMSCPDAAEHGIEHGLPHKWLSAAPGPAAAPASAPAAGALTGEPAPAMPSGSGVLAGGRSAAGSQSESPVQATVQAAAAGLPLWGGKAGTQGRFGKSGAPFAASSAGAVGGPGRSTATNMLAAAPHHGNGAGAATVGALVREQRSAGIESMPPRPAAAWQRNVKRPYSDTGMLRSSSRVSMGPCDNELSRLEALLEGGDVSATAAQASIMQGLAAGHSVPHAHEFAAPAGRPAVTVKRSQQNQSAAPPPVSAVHGTSGAGASGDPVDALFGGGDGSTQLQQDSRRNSLTQVLLEFAGPEGHDSASAMAGSLAQQGASDAPISLIWRELSGSHASAGAVTQAQPWLEGAAPARPPAAGSLSTTQGKRWSSASTVAQPVDGIRHQFASSVPSHGIPGMFERGGVDAGSWSLSAVASPRPSIWNFPNALD